MEQTPRDRDRWHRIEPLVLITNLVFMGLVVLYLVVTGASPSRVEPLVETDSASARRISALELALQRDPSNLSQALELAHLYQDAGEFPWSYDALRNAERRGSLDPSWRVRLGLAYLELGKNDDSVRVLEAALERCSKKGCPVDVAARVEIFTRVARLLRERRIDARRYHAAADKALREVLKPVKVDLAKMRPKGPAPTPEPEPPPRKASR